VTNEFWLGCDGGCGQAAASPLQEGGCMGSSSIPVTLSSYASLWGVNPGSGLGCDLGNSIDTLNDTALSFSSAVDMLVRLMVSV